MCVHNLHILIIYHFLVKFISFSGAYQFGWSLSVLVEFVLVLQKKGIGHNSQHVGSPPTFGRRAEGVKIIEDIHLM